MVKFIDKLETKLTASFVFLVLVITGMSFFYTYRETKKALSEMAREELLAVTQVEASNISGDVLSQFRKGDENKPSFLAVLNSLHAAEKSNPDIKKIYIYRANDTKTVRFIADSGWNRTGDTAEIDRICKDTTPGMLEGLTKQGTGADFFNKNNASLISGYALIKDSKGNIAGTVGADMSSSMSMSKQQSIGLTIYAILSLSISVAAILIALFSGTIINDINKLNRIANTISTGNMDAPMDIKRNDEIGELAESFGRMVASLKIMMQDDQDLRKKGK